MLLLSGRGDHEPPQLDCELLPCCRLHKLPGLLRHNAQRVRCEESLLRAEMKGGESGRVASGWLSAPPRLGCWHQ